MFEKKSSWKRDPRLLMLTCIMTLGVLYSFVPFAGGLFGAALLIGCAGLINGMLTVLALTVP